MKQDYSHVIAPLATMLFSAIVELSPNPAVILAELERQILNCYSNRLGG